MKPRKIFGYPSNVFFLSVVSLLNDIGGETIKKTIPLYLANVLGIPASIIGFIEGVANSMPQFVQPVTGFFSDRSQKRKPYVVIGQVLRSAMVLLFWAMSWPSIFVIRLLDRGGKGFAEAPRDALISSSAEKGHVGKAFGLNRMFDNAGAAIGLFIASLVVFISVKYSTYLTLPLFHSIVLLSVVPLLANIGIIAFFVTDVPGKIQIRQTGSVKGLGGLFYRFLALSILFMLGNSSDAFIILQSQRIGMELWVIFLLLAGYSLTSSLSAVPLSSLSDRFGRKILLITGWLYYAGIYLAFAVIKSPAIMFVAVLFYGMYYGFTEGSARAFVADLVPEDRRGIAYGIYNMGTGIALLLASVIGGAVWQVISPEATFYVGSIAALMSGIGLIFL